MEVDVVSVKSDVSSSENGREKKKKSFPKPVFFILGNEFCERFCYYGMRAVLTLYFTDILLMDEDKATVMYHTFTMLCYFTPIFGAIIADGWLGKFWTILYLSILYACGNIILSTSSITSIHDTINYSAMCAVGLVVIACGTGGIKPCVSSFGGDQFDEDQDRQRKMFFSIFYFSINAGSLISSFVTPILRSEVHCFDADSCYPLAFGVPAILMIVALLVFVVAKPLYRIVPPTGSILTEVGKCIWYALKKKRSSKKTGTKREHWLDYADDRFGKKFVRELRAVLHIMFLYIPLPVFWSLFDQQGSRWTLQATYMNGELGESYTLQPDQVQTVNPLFILLFIPLFESVIYPLLSKCNILVKALPRMFVGGMFASVAFLIAGFLQLSIEADLPVNPSSAWTEVAFVNSMPCTVHLTVSGVPAPWSRELKAADVAHYSYQADVVASLILNDPCPLKTEEFAVPFKGGHGITVSFLGTFPNGDPGLPVVTVSDSLVQSREKPEEGNSGVRFVYSSWNDTKGNVTLRLLGEEESYDILLTREVGSYYWTNKYVEIEPERYRVRLPGDTENSPKDVFVEPRNGAVYTYTIVEYPGSVMASVVEEVAPSSIHMLWQIPQYVVMTAGEIMFSITGLEFSYSQAPPSMKAVLAAAWLMTSAFGNVIIIIIAEIDVTDNQSVEFFVYSLIMFVVMLLFGWMSLSYEYVDPTAVYADDELELHTGKGKEKDDD